VHAVPEQRPTYIGCDLRSLHQDADVLAVGLQADWQVDIAGRTVTVRAHRAGQGDRAGDGLSVVRAVAAAAWNGHFDRSGFSVEAGDDTARDALQRWSLLDGADRLA